MIRPALLIALALSALVGCGSASDEASTQHDDAVEQNDQTPVTHDFVQRKVQLSDVPRDIERVNERAVHGQGRDDKAHIIDVAQ